MVYLYKKTVEGKPYYYLRVSKRLKGRVIAKDVAYLGSDINKVKERLDQLTEYKEDIRKAYRTINKFLESEHHLVKVKKSKLKQNDFMKKDLLEELAATKLHYNQKFLKQNPKTIKEFYHDFIIEFAFNSNSIEGNTITLSETAKLLKENLTPKNRTLKEIYDMKNSERVFLELLKKKKAINQDLIIWIHDELVKDIDERAGYRTHDIRVKLSRFKATPWPYIKADMKLLLDWYKKNQKLHPLVLAGAFHHKFEKIHPFADGNGRTGRMLMNYILMKNGYPPMIVRKKSRPVYLDSLSKADKSVINEVKPINYKELINYLGNELITSYWNNFLL